MIRVEGLRKSFGEVRAVAGVEESLGPVATAR